MGIENIKRFEYIYCVKKLIQYAKTYIFIFDRKVNTPIIISTYGKKYITIESSKIIINIMFYLMNLI